MTNAVPSGPIRFLLNGEERSVSGVKPTTTILEYVRRTERLTGTKEGCAEGDCGACTVLLAEPDETGGIRRRSVNACIQFLPSAHGRAIETVEHLGRDGPHPAQSAMVERHASQCGFCTPGFVMQLHAGWLDGALSDRQAVKDLVAGNLCRCTGYGPIVDAGLDLAAAPPPDLVSSDRALAVRLGRLRGEGVFAYAAEEGLWLQPTEADQLADLYEAHPDATLVAGATDVGLWVTKQHRDLPVIIDIGRVRDLRLIEEAGGALYIGAAVTHSEAHRRLAAVHPDIGELIRRFAGPQVRNAGTVGGNIANGSPIGDLAPVLIALGSRLYLRKGDAARSLPLEDFFLAYGKQDRARAEFVAAVEVPPLGPQHLFSCHKVSKRTESDISAVMAAFRLTIEDGRVAEARLAFGGMAATPKRAAQAEAALLGAPFDEGAAVRASAALAHDFTPLDDMRASAAYRLKVAGNLLVRFAIESAGAPRARVAELA